MRSTICLLAFALLACGPRKPPGAEAPATDDARTRLSREDAASLAAGFRDVLVAMDEVVKARGGAVCSADAGVPDGGRCADCAAMATELGAVFDRAEPLFARAREVQGDPDDARMLTDAMRAEETGVARLVDEISTGLAPCAGNADLQRVIERMPTL